MTRKPMNTIKAVLVAGAISLTAACTSGVAGLPPLEAASSEVRLAPGDKVRVTVQDLDAMTGDYMIDETGSISVPLIQQVAISGMTYVEVEQALAQRLRAADILNEPLVTVQPLELRPVYLLGEVRQPGEYNYRQGLTVFAAVSMAGGYTYRANTNEVAITRTVGGRQITGTADENTPVLPGDRIRIYERWF